MANTDQVGDLPQWEQWEVLCGKWFHLGRAPLPAVHRPSHWDDRQQPGA